MTNSASESARRNFQKHEPRGPLLFGDWCEAVFLHYAVAPEVLQSFVPMELDLWEGQACVSLVAFTMRRLRPAAGGRLTEWLMRPFATQMFLNLRTYVRHRGEAGIYFITEWNSSRLCARIAPRAYGLPYRSATLNYRHTAEMRSGDGVVQCGKASFEFSYRCEGEKWNVCPAQSFDGFVLERYLAFACGAGRLRYFRVWHPPWNQRRAAAVQTSEVLLRQTQAWWKPTEFIGAHVSSGVTQVWMGRPRRLAIQGAN